jgi:adenine deaminase
VARDVGSIAPCRFADLLIVEDLEAFVADEVIAAGVLVARGGELIVAAEPFVYPSKARASVRIPAPLTRADFEIQAPTGVDVVNCRVIRRIDGQVLTEQEIHALPVEGAIVVPEGDVAHLAVVERHRGTGRIGRGFVAGFGFGGACALAATVAHDSHNLLVVGSDPSSMAVAANRVVDIDGGFCLVIDETTVAEIPLPIAGLMSDAPAAEVVKRTDELQRALSDCGCEVADALTALSFLALPVIPRLRLTDLGLVDVDAFEIVPLFVDDDNPTQQRER